MRSFSFIAKNIGRERYLTYIMGEDCELDEEVLDYCEEHPLKELVKVIYEEDDDYDYLTYDITGKMTLEKFTGSVMNREQVFRIVRNIALGLVGLKEQAIHLAYILLNKGFIYINPDTLDLQFICLPVESDASLSLEFKGFVRQFLANLRYNVDEDLSYVGQLLTYINGNSFNLRGLIGLTEALMEDAGIDFVADEGIATDDGAEVVNTVNEEPEEQTEKPDSINDIMSSLGDADDVLPEIGDDEEDEEDEEDFEPASAEPAIKLEPEEPEEEIKAEAKAEPEEEPKAEAKAEPEEEPKAEAKAEPEEEPKAEVKEEPKAEVKAEPKAEVKAETEEEPKAEAKAEPEEEPKAEAKEEPEEEPKAEVKAEPEKEEPEEEIKAEPEKEEPKVETKVEPEEEPKAEAKAEPEEEPKAEAKTEPEEEPKAEAKTEPEEEKPATEEEIKSKIEQLVNGGDSEKKELDDIVVTRPVVKKPRIKVNRAAIIQNVQNAVEEQEHEQEAESGKENEDSKGMPTAETARSTARSAKKETIIEDIGAAMNQETAAVNEKPAVEKPVETKPITSSSVLSKGTASVNNTMLGASGTMKICPYLIRENTEERIMITKAVFKIGKANRGVDYTVDGNGAVSRQHAIIMEKDGVYYIKDNKSTNHTYVDGKKLEEGQEEILTHDCKVKLGDEEFVFKIR